MARLLFAVHGMGEHGAPWAESVRDVLNTSATSYAFFDGKPPPFVLTESGADSFDLGPDRVALVPIDYDPVFETWRHQLGTSVDELHAFVQADDMAIPGAARLFDWLDTAPEGERAYFWSHALDVLLYRFTLKAGEVRVRVMQQIARALTTAMAGGAVAQASVLAHSLGTAVAHDSLSVLGTEPLGDPPSHAFVKPRLFHSVFMLASVSRVLQSDRDVYAGVVKPLTAGPDACADAFVSVRHTLDPIPVVRAFAPHGWGGGFADLRINHVRDFNVHAFEHYLGAPQVHVPLLNNQLGIVIGQEEYEAAVARDAEATGPPCVEQVTDFVQRARDLVELFRDRSVVELAIGASQFLALARRMREACAGLIVAVLMLLCVMPLHAQSAVRADCDADVVLAMDVDDLSPEWLARHPNTVFEGYVAARDAHAWPTIFRSERERFAQETTLPADARAAYLRQMDALIAEVDAAFEDPGEASRRVASAEGVNTSRFTIRRPTGLGFDETYTLFPEMSDAIGVEASTPRDVRRILCWSALGMQRLLTTYAEAARTNALAALDAMVAQWDAFNTYSYSMYPWELAVNSFGARRTRLTPPRQQWVFFHPSAGVGVAGWPPQDFRRLDVLALEVAGLLVYRSDRRDYRGASLLLTLPASGGPGGGALIHLNRTLRAGYAFRFASDDFARSGGLVVSLDLYKSLTDVPERLRRLKEEVAARRDELGHQ